jgi:hypothetical protein
MSRNASRQDLAEEQIARSRRMPSDDDLGPLFAPTLPEAAPVAAVDHGTSRDAADRVLPITGALRRRILVLLIDAYDEGMTDKELEDLPEMKRYGFSTVRKRRSELFKAGLLKAAGSRGGLTVWVALPHASAVLGP